MKKMDRIDVSPKGLRKSLLISVIVHILDFQVVDYAEDQEANDLVDIKIALNQ